MDSTLLDDNDLEVLLGSLSEFDSILSENSDNISSYEFITEFGSIDAGDSNADVNIGRIFENEVIKSNETRKHKRAKDIESIDIEWGDSASVDRPNKLRIVSSTPSLAPSVESPTSPSSETSDSSSIIPYDFSNLQRSPQIVIPFRDVKMLGLGISKAFNEGNVKLLKDIICYYVRSDVTYRRLQIEQNTPNLAVQSGTQSIINFFDTLMNHYPDGMIAVKSINYGTEAGLQVIRTKLTFKGTLINAPSALALCPLKVFVKIKAKCYLDTTNRVTLFDKFQEVKSEDDVYRKYIKSALK